MQEWRRSEGFQTPLTTMLLQPPDVSGCTCTCGLLAAVPGRSFSSWPLGNERPFRPPPGLFHINSAERREPAVWALHDHWDTAFRPAVHLDAASAVQEHAVGQGVDAGSGGGRPCAGERRHRPRGSRGCTSGHAKVKSEGASATETALPEETKANGAACASKAYPHLPIAFSSEFTRGPVKSKRSAAKTIDHQPPHGIAAIESPDGPIVSGACIVEQSPIGANVVCDVDPASSPTAIADWPDGTTSVMLRNIPNRYKQEELLEEMTRRGFDGAFDFFYLPTDFGTKKNKGYGFVNLRSPPLAQSFRQAFDGQGLTKYATQKVVEMSPAVTQGFEENAKNYLKQQAGRVQNPWFKPMIFVPGKESKDPWQCLPLCEENLPQHLRSSTGMEGAVAMNAYEHETGSDFSEGHEASDAEAATLMESEVGKFLRSCAETEGAAKCASRFSTKARGRRRGGRRLVVQSQGLPNVS